MRGLRSTIALVVVLAGLGAYVYFVMWKKASEPASKQEKVFTGVEPDKLQEIQIKSDKGEVTTLKKDNSAWQIIAPVMTKADDAEASAVASAISGLEMTRVIDENPTDLKDYGLVMPRIAIEFKAAGDKDARRLFLGDKSPTGAD